MSMGVSRDGAYWGKRLGSSQAWKHTEPIDNDGLAAIEKILERPGGSMKWPKGDIAALVVRLRQAEA